MLNAAERSHTELNVCEPEILDRDFERDFECTLASNTYEAPRRHPGGIPEAPRSMKKHPEAPRRHPGGHHKHPEVPSNVDTKDRGGSPEAPRSTKKHPGGIQEAPRRHPEAPRSTQQRRFLGFVDRCSVLEVLLIIFGSSTFELSGESIIQFVCMYVCMYVCIICLA